MFWVKCFHILAWIRLCCCSGQELGSRSHFQKSNQKSSQPWWDAAELLPAPAKVLHADGAHWLLVSVESFHHHWEDKYPYISFSIGVRSRWCSGRDASSVMCALLEASSLVIWKMSWSPEWADGLWCFSWWFLVFRICSVKWSERNSTHWFLCGKNTANAVLTQL